MTEKKTSNSIDETRAIGAEVARLSQAGDVFALTGEIGCGKTEFVRGFVACLCGEAAVRSPTFSIVNVHQSPRFTVYHFDFYRLRKKEELVEIGYYEYVASEGVVLIEWADMFLEALPPNVRFIRFSDNGATSRMIEIE